MSMLEAKQTAIPEMVQWAKRNGFVGIKANLEGYDLPTAFSRPEDEKPYIPDVTAVKGGRKNYLELALKPDNPERTIRKWKLLSTLAAAKQGRLLLFAPKGHKAFAEKAVRERQLNARVISF